MKKLLYLAHGNIKQRTGAGLAMLAYYNALIRNFGDKVDIMMPAEVDDGSFMNVVRVPARSHLKALLSGSLHRYKSPLRNYLKAHSRDYDMCVLNGGLYAGDMMDMIHSFGLKVMVIHHNFEREYAIDNKSILTLYGHTPYFIIKNERMAYLKADINCFLTCDDIDLFCQNYGYTSSPAHLLGVFEPDDVELPQITQKPQNIIVITGSMNSVQTMCGIVDIHTNYYDIIRELCPDWKLVIAGRNPKHEVYDLQKENPENIIVIPNPPVMDVVTNPASVFLCPTNVGGGLKLRVMDGLRMGLPVLVHKVSARGYEMFREKPYFRIYHDKDSFKRGLMDLMAYCKISFDKRRIQADYEKDFSFRIGCERMKRIIESV